MNAKERLAVALARREPDRTPVFEYTLQPPICDVLAGKKYAGDPGRWADLERELGRTAAARRAAKDMVELAFKLGHDLLRVKALPPIGAAGGLHVAPAPADDDDDDPVAAVRRRTEVRRASFKPLPEERLLLFAEVQRLIERRGLDLAVMSNACTHGIWTDVDLMQTMILDEAAAEDHFAFATQDALMQCEQYLACGSPLIQVGGDFSGNRPIISPASYRRFIVPEVRKTVDFIHARGGFAVNTSDGDLWSVIDDYLIGCGVDGCAEIDFNAGMDLRRLKTAYGNRITFFGNLDCVQILPFGTPEAVRKHVWECLEVGRGGGGHVLCAGNAISESVPTENYMAVINAYRDFFQLPQFILG
jgi:hypothetical protein